MPNGAATTAPTAARRPSRAFARIRPSSRRGVGHGEPVLRDRVHLGEHQQHQRGSGTAATCRTAARRRSRRPRARRGRRERDRAAWAGPVEQRHQERAGERQRQHREREVGGDLQLRLADRQREEHGIGQRDRQHRVARHRREVAQRVGVERVGRSPHPLEGVDRAADRGSTRRTARAARTGTRCGRPGECAPARARLTRRAARAAAPARASGWPSRPNPS